MLIIIKICSVYLKTVKYITYSVSFKLIMLGKFSLKELQSQCIGLGIKTYGTKATLIKRIKEAKANTPM